MTAKEQGAAIDTIRKAILAADPRVQEAVKWNAPSFFITDHFATFRLGGKDGLQLILHLGVRPRKDAKLRASVPDPDGLLDWKSPDRAVITIRDAAHAAQTARALGPILKAWIPHLTSPSQ